MPEIITDQGLLVAELLLENIQEKIGLKKKGVLMFLILKMILLGL